LQLDTTSELVDQMRQISTSLTFPLLDFGYIARSSIDNDAHVRSCE